MVLAGLLTAGSTRQAPEATRHGTTASTTNPPHLAAHPVPIVTGLHLLLHTHGGTMLRTNGLKGGNHGADKI